MARFRSSHLESAFSFGEQQWRDQQTGVGAHLPEAMTFGQFRLFPTIRLLEKAGQAVHIGGRALDVLTVLAHRAGEVVTKRDLMAGAWPDVNVDETSLRFQLAALRKTLGDGQAGDRYIITVPGRGYCFVAPVSCETPPEEVTVTWRYLASIVEASRDAIWSWRIDGTITSWNKEAERMLGYAAEEMLGKSLMTLVPRERQEAARAVLVKVSKGEGCGPFEAVGLRNDGKPLPVELTVSAIRDSEGRAVAAATICRDITERKAAEEPFHLAIEAAPNGMLLTDSEGRIVLVNGHAEKMFGYRRDELVGHKIEILLPERFRAIHPLLRSNYTARAAARPMGVGRDLYALRKDGTEVPIEIGLSPIVTERGTLILSAVVDITERKQAEARVVADLRDMTRLNELSIQLVRSGVEIKQNLKAVVETAIGIARADKGSVQLLNEATGTLTIAAQRGFESPFLEFFEHVRDEEAPACSAAMRASGRVLVEDVTTSEIFAAQPAKQVLLDAGVRAVASTPLIDSNGKVLGMISTHFGKPHRPAERELHLMDLLARQTADYLERKRAEEIADTLVHEIQHRSNNLLAVVQAIASLSLSRCSSLAEARAAFEARLQALARANRQLTRANWVASKLKEIVLAELEPFSERTIIEGNDISLGSKQARDFSLTLHELATNAAKYGALSNGSGIVKICWAVSMQSGAATLDFTWRETGGPPIGGPTRCGFGTALIKAIFPNARAAYAADGFSLDVDVRLGRGRDLDLKKAG